MAVYLWLGLFIFSLATMNIPLLLLCVVLGFVQVDP